MSHSIDKLLSIMAQLREPSKGCPWDLEQTFKSLTRYTLEEAYEVIDVIEKDNLSELPDELGDLLFQIVFYSQIGKETRQFDFNDVVNAISEKLIRRHPHVFADEEVADAGEQTIAWERHKAAERSKKAAQQKHYLLDGISDSLPAMTRAMKLQKRAAQVNFDWPDTDGVYDKIYEELDELKQADKKKDQHNLAEELGDLLFSCVNLVRHYEQDPETVLRASNHRFQQRFNRMQDKLAAEGGLEKSDVEQMNRLWEQVKKELTP